MYVVIAGCGRVGANLALSFSYEGHNVVIIDRDPSSFSRLGGTFNGVTLTGMAFDEEILKEAGLDRADAFAAVTNFDNTNLMATQIASNLFHVPKVIARLYNPDKRDTYRKLGIDYVCGTTLVAEKIQKKLLQGKVIRLLERPEFGVSLVEFTLNRFGDNLKVNEITDPETSVILTLYRDNRHLKFTGDTLLRANDTLVMALKDVGWKRVEPYMERED